MTTEPGIDAPGRTAGERLVVADHEARYRWAAAAVAGREVLDAGCGAGEGSAVLARAGATRVTGVDPSEEAIGRATERAGGEASFASAPLERLPFDDASFDIVVCFDSLEHAADREAVLAELRRVLRTGGAAIVSSQNRDAVVPGSPGHEYQYTPAELEEALARHFANVGLFSQRPHAASLVAGTDVLESAGADAELRVGVRRMSPGRVTEGVFALAVASDAPLPELRAALVLADTPDLELVYDATTDWRTRARLAESEATAAKAELAIAVDARLRAEYLLARVQRSPSWRITAPLRALKRVFVRRRPEPPTIPGDVYPPD